MLFENIINEVLSIADIVDKKSILIKKVILDDAKTIEWENSEIDPDIKYKSHSFKSDLLIDLCPNITDISYNCINFPDEKMYREHYYEFFSDETSHINIDNRVFLIQFSIVNDNILVSDFDSSIYHELEHLYQLNKAKDNYILKDGKYRLALKFLNDNNSDLSALANFIYLTSKPELDANINGLYAYLKKHKPQFAIEFTNSPVVANEKYYIDLYYQQVYKMDDDNDAFRLFQVNKKWCIDRYNNSIKYLFKKIGKIYTRYRAFESKFKPFFRKPMPKYLV
jgi:hypothetical protein